MPELTLPQHCSRCQTMHAAWRGSAYGWDDCCRVKKCSPDLTRS